MAGRAHVRLVYIAEAHAADVWPINSTRCGGPANDVTTPTTLAERCATARAMSAALPLADGADGLAPLLVDGMDDAFLETYAAWPIRVYGVARREGALRLELIAQPDGAMFALPPYRDWLLAAAADAEADAVAAASPP